MDAADRLCPGKVRDRPRHAQHPRIAARRQPHRLGRLREQMAPRLVGGGYGFEQLAVDLGIGARLVPGIARRLDRTRRGDARRDLGAALGGRRQDEVGGAHRAHLDMQVDTVKE